MPRDPDRSAPFDPRHPCAFLGLRIAPLALVAALAPDPAPALDVEALPLVPFPREIAAEPGVFRAASWRAVFPEGETFAARELEAVLAEAGVRLAASEREPGRGERRLTIAASQGGAPRKAPDPPPNDEGYALRISPGGIALRSRASAGFLHGIGTLKQLVRGCLAGGGAPSLPCLRVRDWPALRYRGFSDDITRGPSTTLAYLEREVRLAAEAKLNFLTYYLEHQFAFRKHPEIGPAGGSLTAEELRALVAHARPYGVAIVGNQQSFGHFAHILKHPRYAPLRETDHVISPVFPETYELLDDLYGEQLAALEAPLFNVCCDETWGLGTGPAKALAAKVGVGRVYADHILALHRIVHGKYGRRMMMWGDIILRHPEELPRLPRDIIMLTWGYGARPSFEDQILPFARAGFDFFVCPGVACWGRLIPDFATAEVNIRHFVRDGVAHGALGMLDTTWDDSGENLNGWNAYGILWGAECAWTGSATDPAAFARRAGAVLFGERDGLLARVVAAVKAIYALPGTGGMADRVFWSFAPVRSVASLARARARGDRVFWSFAPVRSVASLARARARVDRHVALTKRAEAAAEALAAAARRGKHEARALRWAVRRLGHIARRRRLLLDLGDPDIEVAEKIAAWEGMAKACAALEETYGRLWRAECRPYHLDVVEAKFDRLAARYGEVAVRLRREGTAAFAIAEIGARWREGIPDDRLSTRGIWRDPSRSLGTPIAVRANGRERFDLPVELVWRRGDLGPRPTLVDASDGKGIPVQRARQGGRETLAWIVPGRIPADGARRFVLYHGGTSGEGSAGAESPAVRVTEGEGGLVIDTDPAGILVRPEGAHIYAWRVAALGGRDVTSPGEEDWHGYLDTGGAGRAAPYEIEIAARGPVLARLVCRAPEAPEKTIDVWAGMPWVEVFLEREVPFFWNYDGTDLAGDGPTPGEVLFSDGFRGEVGPARGGPGSQRARDGVIWSAKFRDGDRMLALLTPEVRARHLVGPGETWGGVGIERSPPALHFIVWADRTPGDVRETMDRLASTLTLRPPPEIAVGRTEERP